jgi:hypothetical protein
MCYARPGMTMKTGRPHYDQALEALQAAHVACLNHPDRDVLGMSHGPFSGVNVALGIIAKLEAENAALRGQSVG